MGDEIQLLEQYSIGDRLAGPEYDIGEADIDEETNPEAMEDAIEGVVEDALMEESVPLEPPRPLPVPLDPTALGAHELSLAQKGELVKLAIVSGLYGLPSTDDQAEDLYHELLMKAMVGEALGLHPATSFHALDKIKDKLNIGAELKRALALRAGYEINLLELTHEVCTLSLRSPQGDLIGCVSYTIAEAQEAGLLRNEVWHQHRQRMLVARCSDKLVSLLCPHVFYWCYGAAKL